MSYWGSGYWHANYWHADFWGEYVDPAQGEYWHTNYWHANYWATGYWVEGSGVTTNVNQTSAPQMTMIEQRHSLDITAEINTTTPTMTLSGLQAAASNDVTVSQVSTPTMTLTGINASSDTGTYYVADINVAVFMSSAFTFTESVVVAAPTTMTMTANQAAVQVGDAVTVGITSTPTMTMTAQNAQATNHVVVMPVTPSMTMSSLNVQTGFGTIAEATAPSMTMTTLQTNVTGTNADLNEMDATFDTMMMSGLNVEVVAATASRRKGGRVRRKYYVEIDNQVFVVADAAEARGVLASLRQIAREQADTDKPIKAPTIKVKTGAGKESRASGILSEVRKTKNAVAEAIKKQKKKQSITPIDSEIAMLMQRQIWDEEDEEAILALLLS